MKPRILIIDDEEAVRFALRDILVHEGYTTDSASSIGEAKKKIKSSCFHLVLLDLLLPDGNSIDWIEKLREENPNMFIIIVSGVTDISVAVEAMKKGADNYLTKPIDTEELRTIIGKGLEFYSVRKTSNRQTVFDQRVQPYFGSCRAMTKVKEMLSIAAESDLPVLFQGETGTGKGVMAKWIHDRSSRRDKAFVEVNCSSLKGEIMMSELFGHAKGAFTSAVKDREGLIEVADGGTLFLDEIGDMDQATQTQLLKVLEEKSFRRVGEVKLRYSKFFLICATSRNLYEEVREGRFRSDLFYRIHIFPIQLPSLRGRIEDLEELVSYLQRNAGFGEKKIPASVLEKMKQYSWPGNVRELKNVIERAQLFAGRDELKEEHFTGLLFDKFKEIEGKEGKEEVPLLSLEEAEGVYIEKVMKQLGGDVDKVINVLQLSRSAFYRKLKKHKDRKKKN